MEINTMFFISKVYNSKFLFYYTPYVFTVPKFSWSGNFRVHKKKTKVNGYKIVEHSLVLSWEMFVICCLGFLSRNCNHFSSELCLVSWFSPD